MAFIIEQSRVELSKTLVWYKKNFDRSIVLGNAENVEGYYVLLYVQDGISKMK